MEDTSQDTAVGRFQKAFNGLNDRGPLPDFLYHYTDSGGLDGILRSKSLWLSHFEFLNDAQEFIYARDFMMSKLRHIADSSANERERSLATHLHARNRGRAKVFFVFSLCVDGNQLSQWRAYAPRSGGYAIGFRGEWLGALAAGCGASLVPVKYGYELPSELFDLLFAACLEVWDDNAERNNFAGVDALFAHAMSQVAVFCKNEAFREEQEWRLIVQGRPSMENSLPTRPRGPYMVPYVSVSFATLLEAERNKVPPRDLFSIKIAPGMDQTRAQIGLTYMLRNYEVRASVGPNSIPYRPE